MRLLVTLYGVTVGVDHLDDMRYRMFQTVLADPKFQFCLGSPTRDSATHIPQSLYPDSNLVTE